MLPTIEQTIQALQHLGSVQSIRVLETFEAYADIVALLQISYSNKTKVAPETLFCKVFGEQWYETSGKAELTLYRDLAPQMPEIPVPDFYGYIDLTERKYLAIFLEDLQTAYISVEFPVAKDSLKLITDTLASLHARWWEHDLLRHPKFLEPELGVTRMPQALSPDGLAMNASQANRAIDAFLERHMGNLSPPERDLLTQLAMFWQPRFEERVQHGQEITLIHGDFHLLGNIFFAKQTGTNPKLKIIDWTQMKRGLGVHDLMYVLLSVETEDRVTRDRKLIEHYYHGLRRAGISNYDWDQCLWDYRFSLLTNVFQCVFQDSLMWFRKTVDVIEVWEAQALLAH